MRLERPRRWPLTLALLGIVLALLLGAVAAVPAPWNPGVPGSVIVFGGSDQAASPVKPRTTVCMLKLFLNAPAAPGRPNIEAHRAL